MPHTVTIHPQSLCVSCLFLQETHSMFQHPYCLPLFPNLAVYGILHMQLPHQLQWLVPWANPKQRTWTKLKTNHSHSPHWDPLQTQITTGSNPEKQFDNSHEKYTLRQSTLETKHNCSIKQSLNFTLWTASKLRIKPCEWKKLSRAHI